MMKCRAVRDIDVNEKLDVSSRLQCSRQRVALPTPGFADARCLSSHEMDQGTCSSVEGDDTAGDPMQGQQ